MEDIIDKRAVELESRISSLVELVENQPQEWYKLLIERLVTQELLIEDLAEEINELKKFEEINSAIIDSKLLESPSVLKDSCEFRAISDLLPDQGFYTLETTGTGDPYRWTKQNFHFDVPINRETEKSIELNLLSSIKPELLERIECYANGEELFLEKVPSKNGARFKGILEPAEVLSTTKLSFSAITAYTPKELDPEVEDGRELAVTFTKLIVS